MRPRLSDAVELERVTPDEVVDTLTEVVNLAWQQYGNDARCNVYATWLGWLLQERLAANLQLASTISEHETVTAALLMRVEALEAALREMLKLHGKPHREEWLNQPAYEYAVDVHERANAALAATAEGGGS